MKIGELAKEAGVNIQTIRFYEREKLLAPPPRTRSGYRDYSARDLERLHFIQDCQRLGFTLADTYEVLEFHRMWHAPRDAEKLKPSAQRKLLATAGRRLKAIDEKMEILSRMKRGMTAVVDVLEGRAAPVCPAREGRPARSA
jgi:MerR family mercuric resistance operon transcriptional regulator